MVQIEDILSLEFMKKADSYSGSKGGIRYRFKYQKQDNEEKLMVDVWPEPFNFSQTKPEYKLQQIFTYSEEGIVEGIAFINEQLSSLGS